MLLIEDSRQQVYAGDKHRNIHDYCERKGIRIIRQPLPYGDYALCDDGAFDPLAKLDKNGNYQGRYDPDMRIVIDTKRDIKELVGNLMSGDHRRVRDECIRAQEAGSQLIFLIEEMPPCGRIDLWESPVYRYPTRTHRAGEPMTRADPRLLRKCMITMQEKYGCKFRFCDGRQTGKQLFEYLTGKRT